MRGILGERRGRVKSRNMRKGPMDKGNGGGGLKCGREGMGEGDNGGKKGKGQVKEHV